PVVAIALAQIQAERLQLLLDHLHQLHDVDLARLRVRLLGFIQHPGRESGHARAGQRARLRVDRLDLTDDVVGKLTIT
ncbi:hypothetical protein PENTCL1PPCAC_4670, partial [Pristionchus entomophagus]